jgi:hypothetical protein
MIMTVRSWCLLLLAGCESVFPLDYTLPEPCGTDSRYQPIDAANVDPKHAYRLELDGASWPAAEATCVSDGGHLVVFESFDELGAIQRLTANAALQNVWVGIARQPTDPAVAESFTFVTGGAVPLSMWRNLEPNNSDAPELAAELGADGLNDKPHDTTKNSFVCECDNLDVRSFDLP